LCCPLGIVDLKTNSTQPLNQCLPSSSTLVEFPGSLLAGKFSDMGGGERLGLTGAVIPGMDRGSNPALLSLGGRRERHAHRGYGF